MSESIEQFKTNYWGKLTRGGKLSGGSSALGLISFFLPWLLVSCGGSTMEFSGYELATGANGQFQAQGVEPSGELWLVLIAFVAGLFITYRYIQRLKLDAENTLVVIGVGIVSFLVLAGMYNEINQAIQEAGGFGFYIELQFGFWLSILASIGLAYGGYLNFKDSQISESKQ